MNSAEHRVSKTLARRVVSYLTSETDIAEVQLVSLIHAMSAIAAESRNKEMDPKVMLDWLVESLTLDYGAACAIADRLDTEPVVQ